MKLLRYIFELPLICVVVWAIYNVSTSNEGIIFLLWPKDTEVHANTKLVLFVCIFIGYLWGKINAWFKYSPLRRDLRQQKKANKVLNKEHEKLNETVSGLKQNIIGLQEKAKTLVAENNEAKKGKISLWIENLKNKFTTKKGI